jgi:hypothetical protein
VRERQPQLDDRVLVVAATRRPITKLYVTDASGQDRSVSGPSVFEQVQVGGHAVALLWERCAYDARWVIAQARARGGRPVTTGFAIESVPDRVSLLVLVEDADGELRGSLHHLPVPRDPAAAGDPLGRWRALRVGALAQRALRDRRRVDLAALVTDVDLDDLARTSPACLTALRLLARRHNARPLLAELDAVAGAPVDGGDERAVFLDAVRDPAALRLPPGADLRWDSALLSFTLPPGRVIR